ncbi:hypothetical protein GGX14DRAFT_394735 [Mycena pura]|uniref:Uncharacterized protein n=1 Tax=Mycena pura TaxID=153505 RepID=A0AAD6VGB6_9AGAR|nr:hypothetical protein GGX14DRAFT_394735 [Mycena pura]
MTGTFTPRYSRVAIMVRWMTARQSPPGGRQAAGRPVDSQRDMSEDEARRGGGGWRVRRSRHTRGWWMAHARRRWVAASGGVRCSRRAQAEDRARVKAVDGTCGNRGAGGGGNRWAGGGGGGRGATGGGWRQVTGDGVAAASHEN